MGFNWKYAISIPILLSIVQLFLPAIYFPFVVILILVVIIVPSRVARHNLSHGHQWVGDGKQCEVCEEKETKDSD